MSQHDTDRTPEAHAPAPASAETPKGVDRRAFLTGAGLAGAAVAGAAAVVAEARESPEEQIESRYRPTEHVERFYALNRL